jgi:hypothetical protein
MILYAGSQLLCEASGSSQDFEIERVVKEIGGEGGEEFLPTLSEVVPSRHPGI